MIGFVFYLLAGYFCVGVCLAVIVNSDSRSRLTLFGVVFVVAVWPAFLVVALVEWIRLHEKVWEE